MARANSRIILENNKSTYYFPRLGYSVKVSGWGELYNYIVLLFLTWLEQK